jgi:hypothetical protein
MIAPCVVVTYVQSVGKKPVIDIGLRNGGGIRRHIQLNNAIPKASTYAKNVAIREIKLQ